MALRLCLDVNVWVNYYLAIARGRGLNTAASGLADAAFAGACRLEPVQLVVSHAMLTTLESVLRRIAVTEIFADMARDQVEAAADNGYLSQPPFNHPRRIDSECLAGPGRRGRSKHRDGRTDRFIRYQQHR